MTDSQTVIDSKYCLLAPLGQGGMGAVYRVRHMLLDKEMALKTFKGATLSTRALLRFHLEVQAVARLSHSHIVQVYDFGMDQCNRPYYTMELLNGQSLAERLSREGRLPFGAALTIFRSVAAALLHAHNYGIVHRDVKPGNIFLARQANGKTTVKVLDFGLAKLISTASRVDQADTNGRLTCGSPLYMSPEHACGQSIDVRSDIYSFGCTLFESLTGEPPFVGQSAFATLQMHQMEKPPKLSDLNPGVDFSPQLEAFVAKLLAKNKIDRYQTFEAVLIDLAIIEQGSKTRLASMAANLNGLQTSAQVDLLSGVASDSVKTSVNESYVLSFIPPLLFAFSALFCAIFAVALMFVSAISKPAPLRATPLKMSVKPGGEDSVTPVARRGTKELYCSSADVFCPRIFHFPAHQRVGYIGFGGLDRVSAQGLVVVPRGKPIVFECGGEAIAEPHILSGFRPDEIYCLVCRDRDAELEPLLLSTAHNLSGLHGLDLSGCTIEAKLISVINQLPLLDDFSVADSNLSGADMVGLKRLPYLRRFIFSHNRDASTLIKALAGSPRIKELSLDSCSLSDEDLRCIAQCSNLVMLSLDDVPLDSGRLKMLSRLAGLKALHIACSGLGPECIVTLRKFKNLTWLRLGTTGWSAADKEHLRWSLRPDCVVVDRRPVPNLKKILDY